MTVSVTIQPSSKDATLRKIDPTLNNGADVQFLVNALPANIHRPILEFDLSGVSLPDDAVLTAARLWIYRWGNYGVDPTGRTYWCYKLCNQNWIEGTGTFGVMTLDGACWNNAGPAPSIWTGAAGQNEFAKLLYLGGFVYAAMKGGAGTGYVIKIDPATMTTVAVSPHIGYHRGIVALGDYIYVSVNSMPAKVVKLNPTTLAIVDTWTGAVGQDNGWDVCTDGTYLYTTIDGNGVVDPQVVKIDPATMTTVATWVGTAAERGASGIVHLNGYVYFGTQTISGNPGEIVKINASTMATVSKWTGTASQLYTRWITDDGTYIYPAFHTTAAPTEVPKINPATMTTVATWTGAAGEIRAESVAYDGSYIYVSLDIDPGQAIKIDRSTMTTVSKWTGAAAGQGFAYSMCFQNSEIAFVDLAIAGATPGKVAKINTCPMSTVSLWKTAGGDYVTANPAGDPCVVPAAPAWMDFNVLPSFLDALGKNFSLLELLVKDQNENTGVDTGSRFHSKQYAVDPLLRPKIIYTYGVKCAVTTLAASAIMNNQADGNGNITSIGSDNVDERGFEWGLVSGTYPNQVTQVGVYGVGAYSLTMAGLNPGTTYYYRAKAHNAAGWSYGEERSFSTLPLPEVSTDTPAATDETTIDAQGTILTTGGDPTCDKRGFVYGLTSVLANPGNVAPGASGYSDNIEEAGAFGVGAFSITIGSLTVSSIYFIRAYIHNSSGYTYGEEILVITNSNVNILFPTSDYAKGIRFDTSPSGNYPNPPYKGTIPHHVLCRVQDAAPTSDGIFGYLQGNCVYEHNYYNHNFYRDIFDLNNPLRRNEGIVKVKWKGYILNNYYPPYGKYKRALRTHATIYDGAQGDCRHNTGWVCEIFYNNPFSGAGWTLAEADDLQAGVSLGQDSGWGFPACDCVRVYVIWANAAVNTVGATSLGGTIRRLFGAVTEDEAETCTVHFEWGATVLYGNVTANQTKAKDDSFNADVDIGALPSIHFRAVIVTDCGETFYGADGVWPSPGGGGGNITNALVHGTYL